MYRFILAGFCLILLAACSADAPESSPDSSKPSPYTIVDFYGEQISLDQPAKRIVALAPHLVENVYSAGAGHALVGVVKHSDFPEEATLLPIVGGYTTVDTEAILALEPDLVLAWESGNSYGKVQIIKELGLPVYVDRTETLEQVAKSIRDIGILAGTKAQAEKESQSYLRALKVLRDKYHGRERISTFYQVWNSPIRTISGNHIISATIELCGGQNIYADAIAVSPTVNIESVLERNPQAIIASGMAEERPDWLDEWKRWSTLRAVKKDALFFVHPDHIQRHTTRLLLAAQTICDQLDVLRSN